VNKKNDLRVSRKEEMSYIDHILGKKLLSKFIIDLGY
jgi:hypothetical protein